MKKIIIKKIAFSILIFGFVFGVKAQCPNTNIPFITVSAPDTPGVLTTMTSCMYGGEYLLVNNLLPGSDYTFETCGDSDFDSQITLYDDVTGAFLGYNDDFCGLQSKVTFTSNGNPVRVLVNKFNCASETTCMTLNAVLGSAGCTEAAACNYDPTAAIDDGSCDFSCYGYGGGCPNFNTQSGTVSAPDTPGVLTTMTSCMYGGEYLLVNNLLPGSEYSFETCGDSDFDSQITLYDDVTGAFLGYNDDFCGLQSKVTFTSNGNPVRVLVNRYSCTSESTCMTLNATLEIAGCTDANACNYDPTATIDDGSCDLPDGCTDPAACNYDALADCDDASCEYISCLGCMYAAASNYDATATIDDGSCVFEICDVTSNDQEVYDAAYAAGVASVICPEVDPCPMDLNNDNSIGTSDLLELLGVFGIECLEE